MTDYETLWQQHCDAHLSAAEKTFSTLRDLSQNWTHTATEVIRNGKKIMFFGNGGSASDAQHLAAELSVRYVDTRQPIAGLCLSLDPSAMTACANDFGFEHVFARQIDALGKPGDMAVGISTSGKSPNVLKALEAAKAKNIYTVGLTGENGGSMQDLCDILFKVPAQDTATIQEMHIFLGHVFCASLEQSLELLKEAA